MKILFLGNSNFVRNRLLPVLNKTKEFKYNIASIKSFGNNKKILYNNYVHAMQDRKFNIVYISLINKLHFKYAKKALHLGHNVIVDKPLSLKFKESMQLLNIAKKKNLLLAEAVLFNYHEAFYYIKKKTNNFKKIYKIDANFHIPHKKNIKLMNQKKLDCLSDMSSYASSLARIFFNNNTISIKKTYLEKYEGTSLIKKFQILLNFENGKKFLNASFSYNSEYESSIKFYCNKFNLEIPTQAFALRENKTYNIIKKENNIRTNIFFRDNNILNFFNAINKSLKTNDYKYFYNCIEYDNQIKKKLNLFNE
jgi:predicted dehydrogenase